MNFYGCAKFESFCSKDKEIEVELSNKIYTFVSEEREINLWLIGNVISIIGKENYLSLGENIVSLYLTEGIESLGKINGSFIFILYDRKKQKLFIGRDFCGQINFYYSTYQEQFIFSLDPEKIRQQNLIAYPINPLSIHYFFDWQCIPAPWTLWRNIFKIKAGEILEWHLGEIKFLQLKQPFLPEFSGDFEEACSEIRRLVQQSIKECANSYQEKCGTFLSGGIDSTIISSLWGKECHFRSWQAKIFNLKFKEHSFDESKIAQQTASLNQLPLQQIQINSSIDYAKKKISSCYEPLADASLLALGQIAELADETLVAILSGDGGDEFFGGYNRTVFLAKLGVLEKKYLIKKLLSLKNKKYYPKIKNEQTLFGKLQRIYRCLGQKNPYRVLTSRFLAEERLPFYSQNFMKILQNSENEEWLPQGKLFADYLKFEQEFYLTNDLAQKQQFAFTSLKLKAIAPFMDLRLRMFVSSLPIEYILRNSQKKALLKETFALEIPDFVKKSPKKGFGVPIVHWLRQEWKDWSWEILNDPIWDNYFQKDYLKKLWFEHQTKKCDHSVAIYSCIVLYYHLLKGKNVS